MTDLDVLENALMSDIAAARDEAAPLDDDGPCPG